MLSSQKNFNILQLFFWVYIVQADVIVGLGLLLPEYEDLGITMPP